MLLHIPCGVFQFVTLYPGIRYKHDSIFAFVFCAFPVLTECRVYSGVDVHFAI